MEKALSCLFISVVDSFAGPGGFIAELYQIFKALTAALLRLFHKIERKKRGLNSPPTQLAYLLSFEMEFCRMALKLPGTVSSGELRVQTQSTAPGSDQYL